MAIFIIKIIAKSINWFVVGGFFVCWSVYGFVARDPGVCSNFLYCCVVFGT